jgi:acetylornithine/N-succinyldiaminopimelate aminotransferase
MVNEIAIKIIRQKKNPATKVLAFRDCFAGRSTTMQEITDNPAYREGQPVYGEVAYLPFFDPAAGLEASVGATLGELKSQLEKHPGKFACLMIEPVQGEGGFLHAPREWYVKVFEAARNAGLAIWADEIQTFVRTGELFAYQKLGLNEYIDVCTIGKLLQSCMVLYSEEFNPKPGLVAGTFSGSTIAMRAARRTIEFLESGGYFGPQGKIEKLSDRFRTGLDRLAATTCKGLVGERRVFGGMIAFTAFDGKMDSIKKLVMRMFDLGVMAYTCGHGPYFVRFLPPLGAMSEAQVDEVVSIVERAVTETK